MATVTTPQPQESPEGKLKIYFLPNLLTAGNLFCGFVALTKIVEADVSSGKIRRREVGAVFHSAGVHL